MYMSDAGSLKVLLSSWRLTELLPQLQDENIGIDELRMMKRHHLADLLCSYKLGTRIRFEYHFERWRREQNKPLLHDVMNANHHNCTSFSRPLSPPLPIVNAVTPQEIFINHKQLQSRATNTVTVRYANVATNTVDVLFKMPTKDDGTEAPATTTTTTTTLNPTSISTPPANLTPPAQPPQASHPTIKSSQPSQSPSLTPVQDVELREMPKLTRQSGLLEENTNMSANAASNVNTCPTAVKLAKIPFLNLNDAEDEQQTDYGPLMHILNSSGYKGHSLLEYYQQHHQFTNVHRTLLIQLIVNFFDMNEYHLSLKVSHNLEEQILKLFPSEKLHYYRNEKRGRIYVKFCNMKRYKRGKPTMKRKWTESMDYGDESGGGVDGHHADSGGGNVLTEPEVAIECGDDDVGDFAQSFEDWHAQQSPNGMHVKTESLSDDE